MRISLLTLAIIAMAIPSLARAQAADPVRVSSPEGVLTVEVATDNDGRPTYAVSRLGRPVVAASRLGFILTDQPKLERGLVPTASAPTSFDETWEQPWGERREIRNRYNETARHLHRTCRAQSPLRRGFPPLRRRSWLPLRVPRTGQPVDR